MIDSEKLYSIAETADILSMSTKSLRKHIRAGRIRTVKTGTTTVRPRRKIQGYSILTFIREHKQRETNPCLSTNAKALPSTTMSSSAKVVAFTALQAQKTSEMQRALKKISSGKPKSKHVKLKISKTAH